MRRTALALVALLILAVSHAADAAKLAISRIYIEYNASGNDLGFHVFLDGENWKSLKIVNPRGVTVYEVAGKAGYAQLGLTELFFEGAEPNLDDFPLAQLLALFPEGKYKFTGLTVGGAPLTGTGTLSHDVPAGPEVSAEVDDDEVTIQWEPVTGPPDGFPNDDIEIVGYQVLVGSFQVTLPADATEVTLPEEFVESLGAGEIAFEVLAIEASGNQSITEGTFEL